MDSRNTCEPIETLGQFIKLPLAIATSKGTMVHGNKANATNVFPRRYPQAFVKSFPTEWKPDCVILEGMFLKLWPTSQCKNLQRLHPTCLQEFCTTKIFLGAKEVHVFDDLERNGISPKDLERERRDDPT